MAMVNAREASKLTIDCKVKSVHLQKLNLMLLIGFLAYGTLLVYVIRMLGSFPTELFSITSLFFFLLVFPFFYNGLVVVRVSDSFLRIKKSPLTRSIFLTPGQIHSIEMKENQIVINRSKGSDIKISKDLLDEEALSNAYRKALTLIVKPN